MNQATASNGYVQRISVLRLAITGALAAGVFYVFCWIGAQVSGVGPPTHGYLELFTAADITSGAALAQGSFWSTAFGLIMGGLTAAIFNALGLLSRR